MDHFYITLPSNSSEAYYGKQPMCNYKTRLAKTLTLPIDDWEVGLAEIIYPHTWNNIVAGKLSIKYLDGSDWVWADILLPDAMYERPEQLIDVLNTHIQVHLTQNTGDRIRFFYNDLTRKFTAYVASGYMVRLSKQMSVVLGFGDKVTTLKHTIKDEQFGVEEKEERIVYNSDKIAAPLCVDLNRGLHTFFIYCNIAEYQLVGDANVPLLRTVPVSGKNGDVVVHSFDNVHYTGLSRSTFQEVEVHITDDTGKKVPFEHGRVIVKLHFKRK